MTTPTFDDLTPPDELVRHINGLTGMDALTCAARWGARHGWEQARQLWPEGNADPPTENDADEYGYVMAKNPSGYWEARAWHSARDYGLKWAHTPRWQPRQPSLQEQALAKVKAVLNDPNKVFLTDTYEALEIASRALKQAGEGVK